MEKKKLWKDNPVLAALQDRLKGSDHLSAPIKVCGLTIQVSTLDTEGELWGDSKIESFSKESAERERAFYRAVASLATIDGKPVSEVFVPAETPPNGTSQKMLTRLLVLAWMSEMPYNEFVFPIYLAWSQHQANYTEALDKIDPL